MANSTLAPFLSKMTLSCCLAEAGPRQNSNFTLSLLYNGVVNDGIIDNGTGFGFDFAEAA
jgi:hypothetical protein